ncbi:MAG TPA: M28 family peptidase, partial [Gemmatimonadaceae bacterium]|nr:M28 family peptidase [Gemmatimonadaceae bacterium]
SASAARARQYCAGVLATLGYHVCDRPFEYSALPGRLGTPMGGLIALVAIWLAVWGAHDGHPRVAVAVLVAAAMLLACGGLWLARRGILQLRVLRARGMNLEATRGARVGADRGAPAVWLVAHLDSKSQPVPLAARAAGIVLLALAWTAALVFGIAAATAPARVPNAAWWWIAVVATVAAVPVIATLVGTRSAGAVDNASGVATVLAAASLLPATTPVGVLITDAEELGLAGARAWCNQSRTAVVLNCDGVDDRGAFTAMYTRRLPVRVANALRAAARREGEVLAVRRLLPGVLVDGVAFADAGSQAMTLSRGTLATLRRIHTAEDNLRALHGHGLAGAARILADAARELMEEDR